MPHGFRLCDPDLPVDQVHEVELNQVRDIRLEDFLEALKRIRRSVPQDSLSKYAEWNEQYGDITV